MGGAGDRFGPGGGDFAGRGLGGGGGGMGGGLGGMEDEGRKKGERPKALVCYICGRQFGTASLEIHLKTCKQKFL